MLPHSCLTYEYLNIYFKNIDMPFIPKEEMRTLIKAAVRSGKNFPLLGLDLGTIYVGLSKSDNYCRTAYVNISKSKLIYRLGS